MIGQAFYILRDNPLPGSLVEFGVWTGHGIHALVDCARHILHDTSIPVYGFDSFTGMPSTEIDLKDNHAEVWRPGGYADTSLESVQQRFANEPQVHLVKGVFADLLPLSHYGIDRVRLARIDCDIYEGYRDSLRLLTPHLQVGTLLLFDEGVAPDDARYHDSIRDSGVRAIREWQESSGIQLREINSRGTEQLTEVTRL